MPKPKSKKVSVDFTGVESGGGRRPVADGTYAASVAKVTLETSEDSGKDYLAWRFKITGPSAKGAIVYHNTSLQPQALFNLKNLLEAMGEDADGESDLDLAEYIDKEVGIEIVNEEYRDKMRPQIVAFLPADEVGEEPAEKEEEEEEPEEKDEEEEDSGKKKPKLKKGMKVSFDDEDGRTKRGVITAIDDDEITVDVKGEEWTLKPDEINAED